MKFQAIRIVIMSTAVATLAAVQAAAQVNDTEAARAALSARCSVVVEAGQSVSSRECSLYNLAGTPIGTLVPAGKNLIVEATTSFCIKATVDPIERLFLLDNPNPYGFHHELPTSVRSTADGKQVLGGAQPARMYIPAGRRIYAGLSFRRLTTERPLAMFT